MTRALVVIDIQNGTVAGRYHGRYLNRRWRRRYAAVLSNIRHLCGRFTRIIFVTHTDFRKSEYREVIDELSDEASVALRIFKDMDDGSAVLASHLRKTNLVYVCGMNTEACVLLTARGLSKKGFSVRVVGDACWSVYASRDPRSHHDALYRLRSRYGISTLQTSHV